MKILNFLKRVRRLSLIERCSNIPHIKSYPVSDHSFYVTLYAMIFADIENERIKREFGEAEGIELLSGSDLLYNVSKVIRKSLIHDLEESETGDILYPLHNESPEFKKYLDFVRDKCVDQTLFSELPQKIRKQYIKLWKTSKDDSKEGILVACMDKFEILMFAANELDMGNLAISDLYLNAIEIILKDFSILSVLGVVEEMKNAYCDH